MHFRCNIVFQIKFMLLETILKSDHIAKYENQELREQCTKKLISFFYTLGQNMML